MPVSLVVTVTGPDKPGQLDLLSSALAANGANWQESRMARLAGQFIGIVLVTVPDSKLAALQATLDGLSAQGLTVAARKCDDDQPIKGQRKVKLELTGQDRTGIVRDISHTLAERGVSIEEFETACSSASWSGEVIFKAAAELRVPAELSTDDLREVLEGLANELMVDITLDEEPPGVTLVSHDT